MVVEYIQVIELSDTNKLCVKLQSGGDPLYEYVYREAAGVSWEHEYSCFTSTELKEWSVPDWFRQIVNIAKSCGADLKLSPDTCYTNISKEDQYAIEVEFSK